MEPWQYEPASDLNATLVERLRRFPREPDLAVHASRVLAGCLLRFWLAAYHRLKIIGRENLPAETSFVMVANHSSHLDALCLLAALPLRKLHRAFPAAARDYFFVSAPRLAISAVIVNALPFERQSRIRHSLELCRHLLANPGNILILFPEGTRTITGQMGRFRPGVGTLVAGTRIPVLPCYLVGAFEAWPKGKVLPRPRSLRLRIGEPRSFDGLVPGRQSSELVSEELRRAVLQLAG